MSFTVCCIEGTPHSPFAFPEYPAIEELFMIELPRFICGTANLQIAIILRMFVRKVFSTTPRSISEISSTKNM